MNHALARLLDSALSEIPGLNSIPPLQKQYIITETSYAYQHFGFSLFGPSARQFLAERLSICSGVSIEHLSIWMELLAFTLLEDFNVLKVVTGEPDWDSVDAEFFADFSRRVLCSELGEKSELGLDAWFDGFVDELCSKSSEWLARLQTESVASVIEDVRFCVAERPCAELFVRGMLESMREVADHPLQILVWRIQFFTTFSDIRQEAKFFMRGNSAESQVSALQMAALLSLLLPHVSKEGESLLPPSPLMISQICTVLEDDYSSRFFDARLFRNWLTISPANLQMELGFLAQKAVEAGLLFEVAITKKRKAYGLTLAAMRILSPFRDAITSAILREPVTAGSDFEMPTETVSNQPSLN